MKDIDNLLHYDRQHVWHPYTSMIDPLPVYPVKSASGVRITLEDGRELIEGMSSWWCAIHGYNHPVLNRAIEDQIKQMAHVMFGGLTHRPAIELAQKLVSITPQGLDRVFYCDSGSVSVEVAIKMALQYMHARGEHSRKSIATISGGYHGDTWHAMSVCDPEGGMHSLYTGRLPIQFFAPRPSIRFDERWDEADFQPMKDMIDRNYNKIAAVIIEPVVQGAGGMWFYHPNYLKRLRQLCSQYNILLIADEIATGFFRTGKMFASQWADIVPDIMCLGKAITGGYLSFAAVMTSTQVADTISSAPPHAFMHGPTFMGNPLACAVANASLNMIIQTSPENDVLRIESILRDELSPAKNMENVEDVRVLGAIGVIQMREPVDMASLQKKFVELGIWLRPFGKLVYIMPPYIINDDDLTYLCQAAIKAIAKQEV